MADCQSTFTIGCGNKLKETIGEKDILLYIEEVKAAGFGEAPTEMYLGNSYMFSGSNSQEHLVTINWEANAGNLTYIKP